MRTLINWLLPKRTKRRKFVGSIYWTTREYTYRNLAKTPILKDAVRIARSELHRQNIQKVRQREYSTWLKKHTLTSAELKKQISARQKHRPLISIILPTYNTNPRFLEECIQSVLAQTYRNWQLCVADDASTDARVRQIIERFAKADKRIKFAFRKSNGHICAASNSALELATGEFVALLDHDDLLQPNALFEVVTILNQKPTTDFVYTDEDKIDEESRLRSNPFFKPDWSPDFLRSINYITHFAVIRRALVEKVGGFRNGYEGAQDWDLFLRVSRQTSKIEHIPKILYSWRMSDTSTSKEASAKSYAYDSQRKALLDDARAQGMEIDSLEWGIPFLMWRTTYKLKHQPKVSIIIPTKDAYKHISRCLDSIRSKTTYANYEVIIVDTGSTDNRVWRLYAKHNDFKVVRWESAFNFSAVCNFGAKHASGSHYLFLNNDTEVISPDWIEGLLQYSVQPHVGAVGCKLYYPNRTLQHAGVVLGIGGRGRRPSIAAHLFPAYQDSPPQDWAQNLYVGGVRNFSAVTAACLMVDKQKFEAVGGFPEEFKVAWNDVDFCLKLHKKGWFNVYTPFVKLIHHESISVGKPGSKQRKISLFHKEIKLFVERWGEAQVANDPFYSPHFRRDVANFRLPPR